MVQKILVIFWSASVVLSVCHEKPGSTIKLCDVPPNEGFKVQNNASGYFITFEKRGGNSLELSRPLVKLGKQHYHIVSYLKLNYFNAFKFCGNLAMDLLSIESQEENDLIYEHIRQNYASSKGFWTSGEDLGNPGDYVWLSNGKLLSYENWGQGKPDNQNNEEHCLMINTEHNNYFWDDANCWAKHFVICEVPSCPYLC